MQVIHDLLQVLLGFVLASHIGKADAVGGLDVDLGVGFAHAAEHHGARAAARLIHQLFVHVVAQCHKDDNRQHEAGEEAQQGRGLLHDLAGELGPGVVQALRKVGVTHKASLIHLRVLFIGK